MLQQQLQEVMDAFPAKSALYCVDLTTGQAIADIGADTKVVSASTIKVMILCCALQDVMEGKLSLDQFLPLTADNFCQISIDFGNGICYTDCVGRPVSRSFFHGISARKRSTEYGKRTGP